MKQDPAQTTADASQLIANRYSRIKSLGKGAFGEVFLANDLKFNPPREVALKILHTKFLEFDNVRQDFMTEASILARLNHPNILRVIDYDITPDLAYIVTDFAVGGSLARKIKPNPTQPALLMSLLEVAHYLEQLAEALDEAHSQGLIHRDLKPLNILLDKRDRPLIADFGLAAVLPESVGSSYMLDLDTSGTPLYMAPEQWNGKAGTASDIYALGIIAFQLITGQPPYQGDQFALMGQHSFSPIPKLSDRVPNLQYLPALDEVIAGVLAKDPKQRTRPAIEFYRRFQAAIQGSASVPTPSANVPNKPLSKPDSPSNAPSNASGQITPANPAFARTEVAQQLPLQKVDIKPYSVGKAVEALSIDSRKSSYFAVLIGICILIVLIVFVLAFTNSNRSNSLSPGFNAAQGTTIPATRTATSIGITTAAPTTTQPITTNAAIVTTAPATTQPVAITTSARQALSAKELAILSGHLGSVTNVAWSPDGKTLASASYDKTIRLWSATGQLLATSQPVRSDWLIKLAWSPDGKTLASASDDNTVRLWSATGQPQAILSGHTDRSGFIYGVAWSPDSKTLASVSSDRTVRLWSITGQLLTTLSGHSQTVIYVVWSPDGKALASASNDTTARLWSAEGQLLAILSGHTSSLWGLAWSPDGKTLASASDDKTVRLWSATGQPLATLSGHSGIVWSIVWSPDSKTLASASNDQTVRLWSVTGQPLATLSGHSHLVKNVAWSPDGKTLASASSDATVRLWSAGGQPLAILSGHSDSVISVAWSPDGKTCNAPLFLYINNPKLLE